MYAEGLEVLDASEIKEVSGGNMVVVAVVVVIAAAGVITGWANGYGDEAEKAKEKDKKQRK
jgi:hypothetical protein